jgi:hypothetical protein
VLLGGLDGTAWARRVGLGIGRSPADGRLHHRLLACQHGLRVRRILRLRDLRLYGCIPCAGIGRSPAGT